MFGKSSGHIVSEDALGSARAAYVVLQVLGFICGDTRPRTLRVGRPLFSACVSRPLGNG